MEELRRLWLEPRDPRLLQLGFSLLFLLDMGLRVAGRRRAAHRPADRPAAGAGDLAGDPGGAVAAHPRVVPAGAARRRRRAGRAEPARPGGRLGAAGGDPGAVARLRRTASAARSSPASATVLLVMVPGADLHRPHGHQPVPLGDHHRARGRGLARDRQRRSSGSAAVRSCIELQRRVGDGDPRHRRRRPGAAGRQRPLPDHEPPPPRLHAARLPGRPRRSGRPARRGLPRGRRDAGPARRDADATAPPRARSSTTS